MREISQKRVLMNHLTLLIKPASSRCNLRCRYCFYQDVASHRWQGDMGCMTEETARCIISKSFQTVSPGGSITFLFQGGEPTMVGLDFYKTFLMLEKEYQRNGIACHHAIQTNGMVPNENWADFFGSMGSWWGFPWMARSFCTTNSV